MSLQSGFNDRFNSSIRFSNLSFPLFRSLHDLKTASNKTILFSCLVHISKYKDLAADYQRLLQNSTSAIMSEKLEISRSKLGKEYPKQEIEATHDQYMTELRKLYHKTTCADCGGRPANWATLKRGKFVCINCAQTLRADASNKVKNCLGTYLWHPDEMQVMRDGASS